MNIRPQVQQRYLHDMAIDQLVADYQEKGYQVDREKQIGDYKADLVATKGDEVIVFEVKTGAMNPQMQGRLAQIGDYVRNRKNHKFLVVVATPPKRKKIQVPELDQLLFDHLVDHFPTSLDELSGRTRITEVSGATVDELTVQEDGRLLIKGSAEIEVELNYGSGDDGVTNEDYFPFTFELILKYTNERVLVVDEEKLIEVNTTSFYD